MWYSPLVVLSAALLPLVGPPEPLVWYSLLAVLLVALHLLMGGAGGAAWLVAASPGPAVLLWDEPRPPVALNPRGATSAL